MARQSVCLRMSSQGTRFGSPGIGRRQERRAARSCTDGGMGGPRRREHEAGLAFTWTCVAWAAAHLRRHWASIAEKTEHPTSLAEALPELVAAPVRACGPATLRGTGCGGLSRRLPASISLSPAEQAAAASAATNCLDSWRPTNQRLLRRFPEAPRRVEPGTLVYSGGLGLTVAVRSDGRYVNHRSLTAVTVNAHRRKAAEKTRDGWSPSAAV